MNTRTPKTNRLALMTAAGLFLAMTPVFAAEEWTGLKPYVTTNAASSTNIPPDGGGGGWSEVPGDGLTVKPGSTFWLGFRNSEDRTRSKFFRLEIDTAVIDDIACLTRKDAAGFSSSGARVRKVSYKGGFGPAAIRRGGRYDEYVFFPQPAWERVEFYNECNHDIKIKVKAWSACAQVRPAFNALLMQSLTFGAGGPGVMRTNQRIRDIRIFPKNIPANMSTAPTFAAPQSSGRWTARFETADPSGQPRGIGVRFVTDGAGLAPDQTCSFSFQMQGQRADMDYVMYALDAATGQYQEYSLDLATALAPELSLRPSQSGTLLQFDTVQGMNYLIESSPDFTTWYPYRQVSGTGQMITMPCLTDEPMGVFRVQMLP